MPKLHEAWPGKNRFCFGCCITGPLADCGPNLCWYVCSIGVLIPFSIFITGHLWVEVTPALPILFYLSLIFTTIFYNLVSCTDPGIIPRKPYLLLHGRAEQRQQYVYNNEPQTTSNRWCHTCHIQRPPRASHCSTCDNCVQVYDHHCPFVNNCIGKRNYRFFMMFLVGVVCSICMTILNFVVFIISRGGSQVDILIVIIIGSIVGALVALPLLGFLIFHLYLFLSGKTTRELLKHVVREDTDNNNQWCNVDPPLIDYYAQISPLQLQELQTQLAELARPINLPIVR